MAKRAMKNGMNDMNAGMRCPWGGKTNCGCMRGMLTVKGIVLILLGLGLWLGWFNLQTTFVILFLLMGLKLLILGLKKGY